MINCTDSPKQKFLRDLEKEILTWQAEGDTVILVADMNKDVRASAIQDMLCAVGLADGPTTHHVSLPATYNHGMNPIDGIFSRVIWWINAAQDFWNLEQWSQVIIKPCG